MKNPFIILKSEKREKEFHVNFNNIIYYEFNATTGGSTVYLKSEKFPYISVDDSPDEIDIQIDGLFES